MNPALYDLTTLLEVMRVQKVMQPYFWINFFPTQINFDTPTITWDKVYGDDRKLAPFVIPAAQGRPQTLEGYETVQFSPAYIKIKDVVSAEMHVERMAGEQLAVGSLTIEQRRNAIIAWLLSQQKLKINNRWEWMAAKAIIDGKVTVAGEDYPEVEVDFRRDPSLTGVNTGAARWTETTADPLGDLKTMRIGVNDKSGARITRHVFGAEAWELLTQRVDLKELMDLRYGGLNTQVTRMTDGYEGMEYMGVIQGLNGAGRIEAWVNTSKYIDPDTGTEEFFLDQKTVVGVSDMVRGVRCYGAIKDKRAGYRPLPIFPKNWDNEDPSVEYLMSQSAPLMVPKEPNATYSLKVAD